MHGDLSSTPLAEVLRSLAADSATCSLSITSPRGGAAVVLDEGRVVGVVSPAPTARIGDRLVNGGLLAEGDLGRALAIQRADGGRLGRILVEHDLVPEETVRVLLHEQMLDALFEIFRLTRGAWDVSPRRSDDEASVPVGLTVDQALVEISRRHAEWAQISNHIADLDLIPAFVRGSTAKAGLEPEEFAMLATIDGRQSVRELADALGYGEFEAARMVHGLLLLGVVRLRGLDDPEPVLPTRPDVRVRAAESVPDVANERVSTSPEPEPPASDGDGDATHADEDADVPPAAPPLPDRPEPTRADALAAMREFGGSDADRATASEPPAETHEADDAGEASKDDADTTVPPRPPPVEPRRSRGEMTELLRELSALSSEAPTDDEPPPRPRGKGRSGDASEDGSGGDGPSRRRGLFGRG